MDLEKKMNYLIVLNDPPYGTERSYNGLRLALSLAQQQDTNGSDFCHRRRRLVLLHNFRGPYLS